IKRALKRGVEVAAATSEEEVEAYYAVHRRWLERAQPRAQADLHVPLQVLAKACTLRTNRRLFVARYQGRIIAGQTVRYYRGGLLEGEFNASLHEFIHLRPNDLLMWKTMEWGCREGLSKYSLNSAHPFRQRTGGRVVPVYRHRLDRTWFRRHDLREA